MARHLNQEDELELYYAHVLKWIERFPSDPAAYANMALVISKLASEAFDQGRETESREQRYRAVAILERLLAGDFVDGHYRYSVSNKWVLSGMMGLLASLNEGARAGSIARDIIATPRIPNVWNGIDFFQGYAHAILGDADRAVHSFQQFAQNPSEFLSGMIIRDFGLVEDQYQPLPQAFTQMQANPTLKQTIDDIYAREASWRRALREEFPHEL